MTTSLIPRSHPGRAAVTAAVPYRSSVTVTNEISWPVLGRHHFPGSAPRHKRRTGTVATQGSRERLENALQSVTVERALWSIVLTALIPLGAACSDSQPDSEAATTSRPGLVVVPPEQRVAPNGPLIEIRQVCYGECWTAQTTPQFAIYDDRQIVRSGYDGPDAPFHLQSSQLSKEDFESIVRAATNAGLDRGTINAAGRALGADGGGYVFVSHLGSKPSVVHAPYLEDEDPAGESGQRQALRLLVTTVTDLEKRLDWGDLPQRWAVVGLHRISREGLVSTQPWPGPSLEAADEGGCLLLGDVSASPELELFVTSPSATFSPAVSDGSTDWYLTPQALMPHQDDCDAVLVENAWYRVRYGSIDVSPSS